MSNLIVPTSRTSGTDADEAMTGKRSRIDYLDLQRCLGADVIDFSVYENGWRTVAKRPDRLMRLAWGQALYAVQHWRDYDMVLSMSEDIGLPLAFLLRLQGIKPRHYMIAHNLLSHRKRPVVRALNVLKTFHGIIVLSSEAVEGIAKTYGVPRQRVVFMRDAVDERFWHPLGDIAVEESLILSVGRARRDYPTLFRAVEGLPLCLRIQANSQWFIPYGNKNLKPPPNVSLGGYLSFMELRELYARAAFVVTVLEPGAHHSAGTVSVKEAMAMGKAVVVASDGGMQDYVREGETGFVVPTGNPSALRAAIQRLLADPAEAIQMGRCARELVEREMSYERRIGLLARLCMGEALERVDVGR